MNFLIPCSNDRPLNEKKKEKKIKNGKEKERLGKGQCSSDAKIKS